ncbi:tyrosine-type recombinase/integrase [Bacillus massiliglaciei]|uniref:tyrosine-type recombinase/integrase n=1 Tax=Bacillus massiliglaciei TaxID=1816693 RepID=UPI000DA629DE|nr:site-specific integrase [Bacillus massiliglaciei]
MTYSIPAYVDNYLSYLSKKGRSPATLKQYSSDLSKFIMWMNDYKGSNNFDTLFLLTEDDLKNYLKYLYNRDISEATIRRLFAVLNRFLQHMDIYMDTLLEISKAHPLRPLSKEDFISDEEFEKLIISMKKPNESTARDYLIERNLSIVLFARYYGLTPKDISSITMDKINLAQKTIDIRTPDSIIKIQLKDEHIQYIRDYRNSIEEKCRPRFGSKDPLFVAFFNLTCRYYYDNTFGMPKALTIRGIQEMIKDEVKLAGLRKISAKHLRNSCILEHLSKGLATNSVVSFFRLAGPFSLHRYKEYLNNQSK